MPSIQNKIKVQRQMPSPANAANATNASLVSSLRIPAYTLPPRRLKYKPCSASVVVAIAVAVAVAVALAQALLGSDVDDCAWVRGTCCAVAWVLNDNRCESYSIESEVSITAHTHTHTLAQAHTHTHLRKWLAHRQISSIQIQFNSSNCLERP